MSFTDYDLNLLCNQDTKSVRQKSVKTNFFQKSVEINSFTVEKKKVLTKLYYNQTANLIFNMCIQEWAWIDI